MDGLGFRSLIGILAILFRRIEERAPVGSQGIVSIPDRDSRISPISIPTFILQKHKSNCKGNVYQTLETVIRLMIVNLYISMLFSSYINRGEAPQAHKKRTRVGTQSCTPRPP